MVFFKTALRCQLFITNIPLKTIARPCSKKIKIGDKCFTPTPCTKSESEEAKQHSQKEARDGHNRGYPCGKDGIGKGGPQKDGLGKGGDEKDGFGKDGGKGEVIFKRPVRLTTPGKVRMGFIPEEWFDFFYPKTGVTGPYIFFIAVGTYLISKERYVMEHEYYSLLSVAVLCTMTTKSVGPALAKFIDKEVDEYERLWNKMRMDERLHWEAMIEQDERLQISCEGQMMLLDAKRENVKLQLEAIYRERLVQVYNEVKNRLDYHVAVQYIQRKLMHKNLIDWVVKEVIRTYNEKKHDEDIEACINELASIAEKERQQL